MRLARAVTDEQGASAVEFALTAPLFALTLAGVMGAGLLFWTQLGLQHGVEMAARCASVNRAVCPGATEIQNYAASQAAGLSVPPSTFTVASTACGFEVTANYPITVMSTLWGIPPLTLTARACFPS